MNDSFADSPLSIDELRASRSDSAADISPRSTLIELLRRIDRGECSPKALVIVYGEPQEDGRWQTSWSASSPEHLITIGLIERVKYGMQKLNDNG